MGSPRSGTAVTEHHLDLALGRGRGRNLVLAPDNDPAGTAALGRTLGMLAERGTRHPVAVTTTPCKDLGELHATSGPSCGAPLRWPPPNPRASCTPKPTWATTHRPTPPKRG